MGQALISPLPLTIERPLGQVNEALVNCGIVINQEQKYSLPTGWKIIDNSSWDFPVYYIIDNDNMIRFSITRKWKTFYYDNELCWNIETPCKIRT